MNLMAHELVIAAERQRLPELAARAWRREQAIRLARRQLAPHPPLRRPTQALPSWRRMLIAGSTLLVLGVGLAPAHACRAGDSDVHTAASPPEVGLVRDGDGLSDR